ncbi:GNAT family N-acetyltransferase [Streptomyces rimosus]|uniref:GNAT family N-acetyltransferase n=1 Tax=Streptomyces rimosus TaxID=1927 RepID=UPI000B0D7532|nr:GNAT family N-acetyltransferase [Streptomyces rimosus]
MYPVTRHSTRLALRELTIDDVDTVHAIYGSPAATEHLSFTPRTRDEVGGIVARGIAAATATPRHEYVLAVVTQGDDGNLISVTRLATDPHQQKAATMGFALRPDAWGVGYGQETVRLTLDLAFTAYGPHGPRATKHPPKPFSRLAWSKRGASEGTSTSGKRRGTPSRTRSSRTNGRPV